MNRGAGTPPLVTERREAVGGSRGKPLQGRYAVGQPLTKPSDSGTPTPAGGGMLQDEPRPRRPRAAPRTRRSRARRRGQQAASSSAPAGADKKPGGAERHQSPAKPGKAPPGRRSGGHQARRGGCRAPPRRARRRGRPQADDAEQRPTVSRESGREASAHTAKAVGDRKGDKAAGGRRSPKAEDRRHDCRLADAEGEQEDARAVQAWTRCFFRRIRATCDKAPSGEAGTPRMRRIAPVGAGAARGLSYLI